MALTVFSEFWIAMYLFPILIPTFLPLSHFLPPQLYCLWAGEPLCGINSFEQSSGPQALVFLTEVDGYNNKIILRQHFQIPLHCDLNEPFLRVFFSRFIHLIEVIKTFFCPLLKVYPS